MTSSRLLRKLALAAALLTTVALTDVAQQAFAAQYPQPDQWRHTARDNGYRAGYEAGRQDAANGRPYDFRDHQIYQQARLGYREVPGVDVGTYRMLFRTGFEAGYDDGFNRRAEQPDAQIARNYYAPHNVPPVPPSGPAQFVGVVPAGAQIDLNLNDTLSSRSSAPGDRFTATVTQSVHAPDGRVLIPRGSVVYGHVATVDREQGLGGTSELRLDFDRLQLPDGQTAHLDAGLSGVQQPNGAGSVVTGGVTTNDEGDIERSGSRATVGNVAAGGVVGSLLGAVMGGGQGAAVGGAVGAGMGLMMSRHGGNVDLPAGTELYITTNAPVHLR